MDCNGTWFNEIVEHWHVLYGENAPDQFHATLLFFPCLSGQNIGIDRIRDRFGAEEIGKFRLRPVTPWFDVKERTGIRDEAFHGFRCMTAVTRVPSERTTPSGR